MRVPGVTQLLSGYKIFKHKLNVVIPKCKEKLPDIIPETYIYLDEEIRESIPKDYMKNNVDEIIYDNGELDVKLNDVWSNKLMNKNDKNKFLLEQLKFNDDEKFQL